MAIQIIDGFQVNKSTPVDSRIVASGSAARNAIQYKYEGLRVFDTSNGLSYVWYNGSWAAEGGSFISGIGTSSYFPIYNSANTITNSLLYQTGTLLKTSNSGNGTDKVIIDSFTGSITINGNYYGNGSQLTSLNASNISSGQLSLGNLTNGASLGQILTAGPTSPIYVSSNQVSVGTASNAGTANNVNITNDTTSNGYIPFVAGVGSNPIKINTTSLVYNVLGKLFSINATASLGTSSGTKSTLLSLYTNPGNSDYLEFNKIRHATGSDWLSSSWRIQSRVDSEYMGYIQFNGPGLDTGISFGTDYSGLLGGTSMTFSNNSYSKEKMRIDYGGRVMIGTTVSMSFGCALQIRSNSNLYDGIVHRAYNDANNIFEFKNSSGANRGQIRGVSSTVVAYDTSSDRRLKKDIQDMPSMYNTIKNLKPSKFTWKENNQDDYGFIAQEVYSILPNLRGDIPYCDITDSKFDIENPKRQDGTDYYYGLDYGKLTPYLTKALQETIQKLEDLTDKIKNASSLEDLKKSL